MNNEEIEVLDEEDLEQNATKKKEKKNKKKKGFSAILAIVINIILTFFIIGEVYEYQNCLCKNYEYTNIILEHNTQTPKLCLPTPDKLYFICLILIVIFIIFNLYVLYKNIKTKSAKKIITNIVYIIIFSYISLGTITTADLFSKKCSMSFQVMKPILYLYPEEDMNITVNFDKEELLTTTYPKFNKEWNVLVKPDGSIYEKGKYYYALYWEEKSNNKCSFEDGFYVEKDNAINFLEEKLKIIGLNDKERNEFIMYWLPKLEENDKSIVHFDLTDKLQKENEMIINPKPDSILRVHINIKKVNNKTNIKEQSLPTFKRSGYTAIEWGGTIY